MWMGSSPPLDMMPKMVPCPFQRSLIWLICWNSRRIQGADSFLSGQVAAWAPFPKVHDGVSPEISHYRPGWRNGLPIAASTPSNAPFSSMMTFPPPPSQRVPNTEILPCCGSTDFTAIPAPTDMAAIRLWPHACLFPAQRRTPPGTQYEAPVFRITKRMER